MAIYITDSLLWDCKINICATECFSENLNISFVTLRSTFKNFMSETSFVSKYFNFFRSFFFKYTFLFPGIKYYQRHIILSD